MTFMRLLAIVWILFWTGLGLRETTAYGYLWRSAGSVGAPWPALSALVLLPVASALLLIWTRTLLVRPMRTTTLPLASHWRWILPVCATGWFAVNGWEGYLSARASLHQLSHARVHSWPLRPGAVHADLVAPHQVIAELHQLLRLMMGYQISGAILDLGLALAMLLVASAFQLAVARRHP
ncbi:MAG: hypothetical protein KGO02_17165 [Alphaproteobacteria bacterium]|nr:hypothetical protein [Alphaproteobacteria bacterium]